MEVCLREVRKAISKLMSHNKEGTSSVSASDEACEDENSKIVRTNDPATWPGVMGWNVRGYLARRESPAITAEIFPETRVIRRVFLSYTAKE